MWSVSLSQTAPAQQGEVVAPAKSRKRKASAAVEGEPASLRQMVMEMEAERAELKAGLKALFGEEEPDTSPIVVDDNEDVSTRLENQQLSNAIKNRRNKVAAKIGGVSSTTPQSGFSMAAFLGLKAAGSSDSDMNWSTFVDTLPQSQLFVTGALFCPKLQAAATLRSLLMEKCLMPTPQFSSPTELVHQVDRLVMLLCESDSRNARQLGLVMSSEAKREFGSGRFKAFTKRDMVKLQNRIHMMVLEDPEVAAEQFSAMASRAKMNSAFEKSWAHRVQNDWLLEDDSLLFSLGTTEGGPPNHGGDRTGDKKKKYDKALCYNCGNIGHLKRDCKLEENPTKVEEAKKRLAAQRKQS